jgi:dihydrofolate reductase
MDASRQGDMMANIDSRVTIHMAASLDGFIARKDGRVDWLETSDEFADGDTLDPGFVETFLKTIDCYVMGSRTYETALSFEAKGWGGRTATNPPSSSLVAICREPGIPLSSTQAILRSS